MALGVKGQLVGLLPHNFDKIVWPRIEMHNLGRTVVGTKR
jgi:hypothetical protein